MKWCNFFNKISLILQALGCAVLYFVIEAICRHSFTEAWTYMTTKPLVFAYNAAFIFTTMLIVYLFRCVKHVLMAIIRWKYRQKSNRINELCGINLTVKNNGLKNENVKTAQ